MSVSFCSALNVNMKNNDWLRLLLSLMTGADPGLRLGGGKCNMLCRQCNSGLWGRSSHSGNGAKSRSGGKSDEV